MTTNIARIALLLFAVGLVASAAYSGENADKAAESVRDDAISKLVAWRTKSADILLKKKTTYEASQPYLTAEALLMATYSLNRDAETVTRALKILQRQVEAEPLDPVAQFYTGEVLKWLGRDNEAKDAWQTSREKAVAALERCSKDSTARYYLGASLIRLGDAGEGRRALKRAGKDDFFQPMVDFQIGLSYVMQKNWKAARNAFDDVHELDPRFAHLYFYRALAWDKLDRKDQFLNDLDQFIKLAPNSPEAKTARAILKR